MDKKDFSKYIFDIYNQGALILSISIGHDLGLFKVFFGTDEPLSEHDIANKLDLKERYVHFTYTINGSPALPLFRYTLH